MSDVAVSGAVLGIVTGLFVGLSTSPVAGIAVTGLVTVAASVLNVGADDNNVLAARWSYFHRYAIAFAIALTLAAFAGYGVRQTVPTPAEALVAKLRALGMQPADIAKAIAAAAANTDSPSAFIGSGIFFGASEVESGTAAAELTQQVAGLCPKLRRMPWSPEVRSEARAISARFGALDQIILDAEGSNYTAGQVLALESQLTRLLCGDAP